jgi:UDP-N-acetylglucosamine acyltransferase
VNAVPIDVARAVDRLCYRFPSLLVDAVTDHEPGHTLVAVKNVTVTEDFFQGHFPVSPLMPGVLMIETLAQAVAVLLAARTGERLLLRRVENAKFRRQVVPGDRVRLEVTLVRRRQGVAKARGVAFVGDQIVAEADLTLGVMARTEVDPTAIVHHGAELGEGCAIGPHAVIGPGVRLGRRCRVGASSILDGYTEIGDDCEIAPFVSIGLPPQDLKYAGEPTRLSIGRKNVFREFVTVHRGTRGGGGLTTIGDRNLFMAYAHVAHDCHVGSDIIFGNGATLGGHVTVEDFATVSAFSGIHQFCRVGRHAFIGGYSVVTKDALPFAKTVGNRARNYGLNTIGLIRRGLAPDTIGKLRRTYRYLLVSKLNTTRALAEIERDPALHCGEVRYLIDFIRHSKRGVTLRRSARRADDSATDE